MSPQCNAFVTFATNGTRVFTPTHSSAAKSILLWRLGRARHGSSRASIAFGVLAIDDSLPDHEMGSWIGGDQFRPIASGHRQE